MLVGVLSSFFVCLVLEQIRGQLSPQSIFLNLRRHGSDVSSNIHHSTTQASGINQPFQHICKVYFSSIE